MTALTGDIIQVAEDAIARVETSANILALAIAREQSLEDERCVVKAAAVGRIMQTENALTHKPHSASSAEAIVETDAEYAAYRKQQSGAVVDKQVAFGRYEAAKLRARLAIAIVEAAR